jgi:NAD(P)-dependent dehydrogenase (short-subunit alcohol dehydrogenase family)
MTTQKTALITGASRGLGAALARELAQRGWALILTSRGGAALERVRAELATLTRVIAVRGDVSDAAHRAEVAKAAHEIGGLDALINNAGTLGVTPRPSLLDYPLTDLEAVFRTNVIAPIALIQSLVTTFRPAPRLLNVTSDAAIEPYVGWSGYGASKAALEQATAILAAERPDWRVYWVDPGDMRTQMHQDAFPGEDISDRPPPEASVPGFMALLTGDLPSGRYRAQTMLTSSTEPPAAPATTNTGVRAMRVVLTIPDFEQALKFYRDGLALPTLTQWIDGGSQGILLDAGQATLELVNPTQAAEIDAIEIPTADGDGQAAVQPSAVRLAFEVGDGDAVAGTLLTQGAAALSAPVLTPWGHRNQRLTAPAGVHDSLPLTISEVVAEGATQAVES